MTVEFNPFTPEFRRDPHAVYDALLSEQPVYRDPTLGAIVLSKHAHCDFALHDPRFSSDPRTHADFVMPEGEEFAVSMLSSDPPDHTRLRGLVNKAFTARRVSALRPRIQQITDDLLDAAQERGSMDVIGDLAYPVPITVIAELLGVPASDHDKFREWSAPIAAALDPVVAPALQEQVQEAAEALREYFGGVAAERRDDPRDDMISALVAAESDGDKLTENELTGMFVLLLVAGHETTVNLIGNGTWQLLRHPAALAALRDDPSLIRTGVEELLRFDGPVQLTARHPVEDVEIDGAVIEKGREAFLLLGAANRDPDVFDDPTQLRLDRTPNPHLTFGQGIHFCVGAPLARIEGQVAIGSLVSRFPKLALAAEPEHRETIVLRGLKALEVTL